MREPFFVPESKLVMDVFKELKSSKNHIAIVIDEHGGTAGLVTMEDILEEIVGEIQDEYDTEEAEILELDNGIYDVAGSCNIDEFLEYFELDETQLTEKPRRGRRHDRGLDRLAARRAAGGRQDGAHRAAQRRSDGRRAPADPARARVAHPRTRRELAAKTRRSAGRLDHAVDALHQRNGEGAAERAAAVGQRTAD